MTDQTRVFQLERLYVSVMPQNGKAPSLQVFGRTPGVKPEQVAECWRSAQIMPPPAAQRTDDMPGSLGIFRGESVDYIIAKAQTGPNGLPQVQYILAPAGAVRALTSNIRLLEGYAKEPIPQYATARTDLPPFSLEPPEPPDAEAQADDLNALITYCKNDLKVVGELLAGLVEAMGLGIINAPTSLHERMTFIQGILTLLPPPVRVAITFATSVTDPAQTKAQIKFLASDVRPEKHLIFDWATGKLLNEAPEDVYAKYIMTQLRLDPSLVLEQTDKLARTAVWRAMRKDDMANALAWVSRRATLDTLILQGLPADRVMVAGVLREDPTLPDDLRIAYTRHLLSLALALDDATYTEIVPAMAIQKADLAEASYEQLRAATEGKNPIAVFHMVERWVMQPPMGVDVSRWRPLLSLAIVAENERLMSGNPIDLVQFLDQFFSSPPALQLEPTIAKIIGVSRRRAYDNPDVARAVFLLAVTYLPAGGLQRLLGEAQLVAQLPEPLRAVFPHLVAPRQQEAPRQLLVRAAEVFGQEYQWVILARLVEWALYLQRYDLFDYDVLRGMVRVAASPQGPRFDSVSQHIIEVLAQPELLKTLDQKAPYYLAQLSMASGRYDEAIRQLEVYQQTVFKGTAQEDMSEVARAVFRELPLKPEAINAALDAMQDSQLKPIARANAYIGALEGKDWSPQLDHAAHKLTAILFADPRMTAQIGVEPVLRLLKANADRHDAMESLKLASALVEYALTLAVTQGPALIQQVYPLVNWSPEVNDAALEILRTYLRRAPLDLAQDLPNIMGKQYGEPVRRALDVTYRLRLILGGTDFLAFAEQILLSSQLLTDFALTYYDTSEIPPMHRVRRSVEAMPGGLSEAERDRLAFNLNMLGQQLLRLAQAANRRKPRSEKEAEARNDQLVKGQIVPETGIDVLIWLGGHFSGGKAAPLQMNREAPSYMFGSRSVNSLLRETDLLVGLLDALLLAFPEKSTFAIDQKMWSAEIDALWGLLTLFKQRQIQSIMAEHPQYLGQAIRITGSKGNEKVFQSSGYGRQLQAGRAQPQNVVEALRWISGYFGYLHS